ncbi:EcoAI/FtnUII family type I restriction enzme subunit R [Algoriphagus sp. A40]|uniref:EcoAI/FtnUII family type I restriction enzme subunit R n=1 Tax=Algoriphagus sp. A40 TaxID=1945863 RepID=UPI00098783B9|nr:DEAD/DEAH box helicase family protein [Algoriphagus sp. A40]OOG77148.1 DEAD/DEAH box helicase [Algoriphagus sp. A40]
MSDKTIHIEAHDSEADTCRKEVLPKLYGSQWTDDLILEQRTFTDGKIIVIGRKARRKKAKRFDYLLRYSQNFPIAIVEAKKKYKLAADGIQQAKDYAQILGLKFAYSTNGTEILEFDFITGLERKISKYPTPTELWLRLNQAEPIKPEIQETFLKPFFATSGKEVRYYQRIAINRAVKAVLEGKKRALLTLATGTGKTTIAFQIIYKLWNNRWNTKGEHRRPKVLFIADRSILVTDPHAKDFAVFGDARCLVTEEGLPSSREVYFSTYHSLAEDSNRPGAFRKLPRDFFDLIVIDECHRGSASDDSNWRIILNYFNTSVQIGLTATPLRDDNKDTYAYFGNPLYIYSLKQGIEDGFLAPYLVHRVVTETDATGFRPEEGQLDDNGELIPDGIYTTPDFENTLSYLPRTKAVVKHLYNFMVKYGRFDKTIVFCVNQEHADQFRREISNLNSDLVQQYPDYVVRIVSEEGDIGKGHLGRFMDIDELIPVIVTTSKLLSTGVDVPTCKNIVIFRMVNSMTEFKQIVGRGTRVREDKEKLFFTILDYTGSATRNFADPDFDGEPPLITEDEIDGDGNIIDGDEWIPDPSIHEPEDWEDEDDSDDPPTGGTEGDPRKKYYISEGTVSIVAENVQILDAYGKLRTIQFTQYAKEQITTIFPSLNDFRGKWNDLQERKGILEDLENNGISIDQLMEITKQQDADPFDLICFIAFDLKPLTRKQRAELLKKNKPDLFSNYSERAKEVLNLILEKYVDYGLNQISPDIISVEPIAQQGNPIEIVNEFGGIDEFKKAIEELQTLLYAEAA